MSIGTAISKTVLEMLGPVFLALEDKEYFVQLLGELGWTVQLTDAQNDAIAVIVPIKLTIESLAETYTVIVEDRDSVGPGDLVTLAQLGEDIFDTFRALSAIDPSELTALPAPLDDPSSWDDIAARLPEYLLINWLNTYQPLLYALFLVSGVIEEKARDDKPDKISRTLSWDALGGLIEDPPAQIASIYGWDEDQFDHVKLISYLQRLAIAMNIRANQETVSGAMNDNYFGGTAGSDISMLNIPLHSGMTPDGSAYFKLALLLAPIPESGSGDPDSLLLTNEIKGSFSSGISFKDDWKLTFTGNADASGALGVMLSPTSGLSIAGGEAQTDLSLTLSGEPDTPWILLGDDQGSRIELGNIKAVLSVEGDVSSPELTLQLYTTKGLILVIEPGEGDSFVQEIFSAIDLQAEIDLDISHSSKTGLRVGGSGGLEATVAINKDLGPVVLKEVSLSISASDGGVRLDAGISGSAELGPIFVSLQDVGLTVDVRPSSGGQGSLGGIEFDAAFKPPTGIGVELDMQFVTGGGVIYNEGDEYRGALALKFAKFDLSAFAILSTVLPGGEKGYSFLASVFGVGFPLSYGFVLKGIGGLIGINRTSDSEALRESLNAGNLDTLLFPDEPIQDAALILETMSSVFPAKRGQYLFGPMAKITWMTPTIFQGSLGIIIEVGDYERILILGSVGASLPCEDAAIVVLQVDFAGAIDFDTGSIAFDATLANSRILTWPITGEFALRSGWGKSAGLVASAGGLHPQYPQPVGFPTLERLTINFGTNNPSLTLTGYTAVTLNSFQAGANASLYARGPDIILVGQFTVEGNAGFETLIMINPFSFEARMWLELKLLLDGDTVCGIGGNLKLSGPNSYYISGRVWVTVLGVDVSVSFDKRWGSKVTDERQYASAFQLLVNTIREQGGLEAVTSRHRTPGVTLIDGADAEGRAVADPTGGLQFVQRVVPLGVTIESLGGALISDGLDTFDLEFTDTSGGVLGGDALKEDFVKGHFFALSDSEKLSGDAFASYRCGLLMDSADSYQFNEKAGETFDHEYEIVLLGEDDEDDRDLGSSLPTLSILNKGLYWSVGKNVLPMGPGYVDSSLTALQVVVHDQDTLAGTSDSMKGGKPLAVEEVLAGTRMTKSYLVASLS